MLDELFPTTHMLKIVTQVMGLCLFLAASVSVMILYDLILKSLQQRKRNARKPRTHRTPNVPEHIVPPTIESQLLTLVNGDRSTALRLVKSAKNSHPGRSEDWYWEKAIEDLIRDRR